MLIEVCSSSIESVKNAIEGGANRIELCTDLRNDGITPSIPLLKEVIEFCPLPVHVLIRPRKGDFFYSHKDIAEIENSIEILNSFNIQGIVLGVLNQNKMPPFELLKKWCTKSIHNDITFHRAFDEVKDPFGAIETLIELGFKRVLTSGQKIKAIDGLPLLNKLNKEYGDKIQIMPGGGIGIENCLHFAEAGYSELHMSAKSSEHFENEDSIADIEIIRKVVQKTKQS